MSKHITKLYAHYLEGVKLAQKSKSVGIKARNPNFPSEISEYIAQKMIMVRWKLSQDKIITSAIGDFSVEKKSGIKKIEVKCFSSNGPISFGPKESWSYLILIDARKYSENLFYVYLVPRKNTSNTIQNLQINKKETYEKQVKKRRRPRIRPDQLLQQLGEKKKLINSGSIEGLLECL